MDEDTRLRHRLLARNHAAIGAPTLLVALFLLSLGPDSPADPEPPNALPFLLLLVALAILGYAGWHWNAYRSGRY